MTAAQLLADHPDPDAQSILERAVDVCGTLRAARTTHEGAALAALFPDTVAADAAVARYSECDPIHVPSCTTADAIAVPAALAAASDGEAFLQAIWISSAVGVRLARAVGGVRALAKGVWPGLLVAPAVAAVADAIARRRPAAETENALILAMTGVSGRAGRPGGMPSGRWTAFGQAAAHGLAAARAARAGATGDRDLIGADWLAAQSPGLADPGALTGTDRDHDMCLKTATAARQGMTALAGFQDLIADLAPDAITAVQVDLLAECLPVVTRPVTSGVRLSEVASLPLTLALAACAPDRLLDIGRDTPLPEEALAFATRVRISAADLPAADGLWPARVTVTTGSETRIVTRERMPGDSGDPGRRAMLAVKLARLGAADLADALDLAPDAALLMLSAAGKL